jgi:hypothetical protein
MNLVPPKQRAQGKPGEVWNGGGCKSDLGQAQTGVFLRKGPDIAIAELPVGQISGVGWLKE